MLHMIQKILHKDDGIQPNWLKYALSGDGLLFLDDTVYAAQTRHPMNVWLQQANQAGQTIYALSLDIQARGLELSTLMPEIRVLSDEQWVDLVVQYACVQTW